MHLILCESNKTIGRDVQSLVNREDVTSKDRHSRFSDCVD